MNKWLRAQVRDRNINGERVQGGSEFPRAVAEEPLDGRRSLRPMKGVIVPRLPRARKVPPAAVGGPSICQERRDAERNPAPVMSDTRPGREDEDEDEEEEVEEEEEEEDGNGV